MSEKDVRDASAGVLQDLKRFQLEKEDDLKRYMVRAIVRSNASTLANHCTRLLMLNVTSIGPKKMSKHGERRKKKLLRLRLLRRNHTFCRA